MKRFGLNISLVMVAALAFSAQAQEDLRDELNAEINVLYPKTTLKKKSKKVAVRQNLDSDESTRAIIINNNIPESSVREQPTSVVEASPVNVSKGQESRKNREEIERSTEDKIVQQLELDRIQAEKERAKKADDIFNKNAETVAPVAPVAPVAIQEVAPVAPVVVAPTQTTSIEVEKTQSQETESTMQYYVGAVGGIGDYATANNVQGKVAGGVSFGMVFPEDFVVEGSLIFSRYDITESRSDQWGSYNFYLPAEIRMDQTNLNVTGKYLFLDGRVRPLVGATLSYVNRKFENRYSYAVQNPYYGGFPQYQGNRPSSWAIDGGVMVGADVKLSRKFYIGADLKYMMNISYERDEDPRQKYYSGVMYNGSQPIEELSYYIFSINATFRF